MHRPRGIFCCRFVYLELRWWRKIGPVLERNSFALIQRVLISLGGDPLESGMLVKDLFSKEEQIVMLPKKRNQKDQEQEEEQEEQEEQEEEKKRKM